MHIAVTTVAYRARARSDHSKWMLSEEPSTGTGEHGETDLDVVPEDTIDNIPPKPGVADKKS